MGIINKKFNGFDDYRELINYLKKYKIGYLENIKVVEIDGKYYAVAIESPSKQIVVGKEIIWYRDSDGYMVTSSSEKFSPPYKIEDYTWTSFTSRLYDEYLEEVNHINLYHIKGNDLEIVNHPINCYFSLLITLFVDKYYSKDEFEYYNYSSLKNISLIKQHILNRNELDVISINPFRSMIKINYKGSSIETAYRAIITRVTKKYSDKEHEVIVGFQIKPVIEIDKNEIISKEIDINYVTNMKKFDDTIIIDIFNKDKSIIKVLGENTYIDLNKSVIDLLIKNDNSNIGSYISILSRKRINELISKNGHVIQYIDNPSETMIRIAIENDLSSIGLIKNLDIEIYKKLLIEYEDCIVYLSNMNKEIQEYMLTKDINNIKYFKNINREIISPFIKDITIDMIKENEAKKEFINIINSEIVDECKIYKEKSLNNPNLNYKYLDIIEKLDIDNDKEVLIIDRREPVNLHIEALFKIISCEKMEIASGFVYQTGLYLISDMIESLIKKNKEVNIIIGSLREYANGNPVNMDRNTAEYINLLIYDGMKVKTYIESFYHGKMYILHGEEVTAVIVGSSNVSAGGFYNNSETNIVMLFRNSSIKLLEFNEYFNELWSNSLNIEELDLNRFENKNIEYKDSDNFEKRDLGKIDIKRKFDYLMAENPDRVIADIDAFKGRSYQNEYCAFYFKGYNDLLILESLKYQNAIYIYKEVEDVDKFISLLDTKEFSTKTNKFVDRVNHTIDESHIRRVKDIIDRYSVRIQVKV